MINVGKRMTRALCVIMAALMLGSLAAIPLQALAGDATQQGEEGLGASTVPDAPRNLVIDQGPGFNWLWWDHPATQGSDLIKSYEIWRGTSSDGEALLDTIPVGNTTFNGAWMGGKNIYNDTSVELETTYYYKIKAISDAGASAFSNEESATPSETGDAPGAPDVVVENKMYGAQVNWTAPADSGSTPIRFYFAEREGEPWEIFPGFVIWVNETWDWMTEMGINDEPLPLTIGKQYNYTVWALNSYGRGEPAYANVVIEGTGDVPSAPLDLSGVGFNGTAILSWDLPADPSSIGFTRYDIYRAESEGGTYEQIDEFTGLFLNISDGYYTGGFFYDTGLTIGETYYYKVNAVNANGESEYSNVAEVFIHPMPDIDLDVTYLEAYPGDGKVLLQWGGFFSDVTGYELYRSESPGTETLLETIDDEYTTEYMDEDVTNGQTYYYKVRAVGDSSSGNFSEEASATPNPGPVPDAPTLVATPDSGGVMLYSLSATDGTLNSPILGWIVYRGDTAGGEGAVPIAWDNDTSFYDEWHWTDTDTVEAQNYFYTIQVTGLNGTSAMSNEAFSFSRQTGDVPDPVTSITATGQTDGITVSWTSPAYQGTANLLYYDLMRNDSDEGWSRVATITDVVGTTEYTDRWVVPGVTYTYRVLASNNYGDASAYSDTDSASTSGTASAPSAPRNLAAVGGPGYVNLTWLAPTDPGSSAITRYDIYRGTTSGSEVLIGNVPANVLTYNDTTGTVGQSYFYIVKAVNPVGSSAASNEVSGTATTPPAPPSAPRSLAAAGHDGYVILTWLAPTSAGTSSITGYDIYRSEASGSLGSKIGEVASGVLTYNDTSVTNDVPYYYTVKAKSSAGDSPASNQASATPSATGMPPGAPTDLTADGQRGRIVLSWSAPTNAGSGVERYLVFRATSSGGQGATPYATVTGETTYTDSTVTPGTEYFYTVKANNTYGTSDASNEASATATAPIAPSGPQGLVATQGVGKVTLNWAAPADDGGSPITGYKVYRNDSATPLATLGPSATSYVDSNGTAGKAYTYWVKAVNSVGDGESSSQVNATAQTQAAADNTLLIAGAGIAGIAAVGAAGYFLLRRKK